MYRSSCKCVEQVDVNRNFTRSRKSVVLHCPFPRTEMFRRSVAYQGPSRWMGLPHDVKNAASLDDFKTKIVNEYYRNTFLEDQVV